MPKIAFIGAGSYGFTVKLALDTLNYKELRESELAFMDIDRQRLDEIKIILDGYFEIIGYKKEVLYTLNLEKALEGADFVYNLVRIGFVKGSEQDMEIPKKYGLFQTVGDTSGVGGIFRGLRTMIHTIELSRVLERVGNRGATILNYTNPQMMLVMAASSVCKVPYIGLCHSVQGTTRQIATYMDIPYNELSYQAAGINHMNWIIRLERNRKDIYPEFREMVKQRGIYSSLDDEEDIEAKFGPTRLDMLNRIGYMVTESSNHFAEYVPFYLRTEQTREKYLIEIDRYKKNIKRKDARQRKMLEDAKSGSLVAMEPSIEYGPEIIHSMVTDLPCKIYANVMNRGLVTNLPSFCAVEVVCLVDRNGVQPCYYGELPTQLAALCSMEINVHQLTTEAILKGDRKSILWAMMMDPVTHSILTLEDMESLAEELIREHDKYFGKFL